MVCKTCGQAAALIPVRRVERRLQCCTSHVDHLQDDPIKQCHTADHVRRGWMIRHGVLHVVKDIIYNSYLLEPYGICECASTPLVNFGVLNDNLIK
jgi:hypothetical protein